ncbi:MAG: helix-turn-helix domain-containing protein [Methylophaga sp.]|nr:helix-turn-helix domain-containing protein [Methylophaga sp.]
MQNLAIAQGKTVKGFSESALTKLRDYPFPGNVRELQNVVERAVAFCSEDWIRAEHLPARLTTSSDQNITLQATDAAGIDAALLAGPVLPTLDQLQKRYVRKILDEVDGNKRRAAALLGIGRRTLYRWLDEDETDA